MVKHYFVKTISNMSDVNVAKKDNSGCKANECMMQKLVFPYEWLDAYDN